MILFSVHLQALYRPYALAHDNVLEQACLLVLLFVICASTFARLRATLPIGWSGNLADGAALTGVTACPNRG